MTSPPASRFELTLPAWAEELRSLVIAGSGPELETLTQFDEGPIHPDWKGELTRRGIEVVENVLRAETWAVFEDFAVSGRPVYNGRGG